MTAASATSAARVPAVSCRSLGVSFGAVRALHDVSLDLAPGRIHALVGQNGAGKTTLAKLLGGLQAADCGTLELNGRSQRLGDVRAARDAGIAIVHQHFSLPPSFTVAEALELAAPRTRDPSVYRRSQLHRRWAQLAAEAGSAASPGTRIRDLPIEARQSLEVVRALESEARILVLDEPTALLTPAATDALFDRLRRLREDGVTILIALHKLREVAAVADTVSVLRDGELVLGPAEASKTSQGRLSDAIIGHAPAPPVEAPTTSPTTGTTDTAQHAHTTQHTDTTEHTDTGQHAERQPSARGALLELVGISSRAAAFEPGLAEIDLSVRAGEIVGVAGVEGNGQRSLVSVVAGLSRVTQGTILIGGAEVTRSPPARRRLRGLRIVPFDRNTEGISRSAPLWLNQSGLRLIGPGRRRRPLVSLRQYREDATTAMDLWRVRYDNVSQPAESLSGGNVQRLILSRELSDGLEVLVAAQPTRGLDFAAADFVHQSLRQLRDAGAGVLVVSSDLDELFELSDRLLVMYGGRIVARLDAPYDRRAVGDAMTGAQR